MLDNQFIVFFISLLQLLPREDSGPSTIILGRYNNPLLSKEIFRVKN